MDRPKPAPRRRPGLATVEPTAEPTKSSPKKLRVRGLPSSCSKENLEFCFESKRKFGRQLSIDEVEFDKDNHEAVIWYKDDRDADTVLQTCETADITLDNEALDIELYIDEEEPERSSQSQRFSVQTGSNEDEIENDDGDDDDDGCCTVEVSGFGETTSDDTLQYYFSNKKKGGGNIKDFTVDREEMKAYFVFEDRKVVESLLERKHRVDQRDLSVRKFSYCKTDLLLKGLTDEIAEETLRLFIEAKLVPDFKLVFNEDRTRALIQTDNAINFEEAVEKCKKKPVEGTHLVPCRVPITNCIIVTNIPEVSEDMFQYYFESKKSGGGETEVEKVEIHSDENYCLVFFVKSEAVQQVCRQKRHTLSNTDICVCPYHTCLGVPASPDSQPKFTVPDPIDLSKEDTQKLKFLGRTDVQREEVNKKLAKLNAKFSYENDTPLLEATLTTDVRGYRNLAKCWSEKALGALREHLRLFDVRVKKIDEACRKDIINALEEVNIPDPDQVAVYYTKGSSNFILVGIEHEVISVWKTMEEVITKVENKIKEARASVEECKNVKLTWKVAYLRKRFIDEIKRQYPDLEINLNELKADIHFKGRREEVMQAEIEMFQHLEQAQEIKYKIREEKATLLGKEEVKERINRKLKTKNFEGIWSVKGDELLLYGDDSRQIADIKIFIEDYLTDLSIRLDNTKTNILKTDEWREIEKKLSKKCKGCIEISWRKKDNILEVVTIEDYENMVSDEVDKFFEKNAIYEESFRCDANVRKYLFTNKESELKSHSEGKAINFRKENVILKGTRAEIDAGKCLLNSMKNNVASKEDVISKPGIHGYFSSEEGKNCIQRTEKSIPCLIILQEVNRSSGEVKGGVHGKVTFTKPTKCAEAKLTSGVVLEVFGGDMTELKVDVLVNASNNKLEHAGGLAAVIVKKGGHSIQDECTDRVKRKGQLTEGDVFMSSGGHLSCKAIVHALGPVWKGGKAHEEDTLKKAIEKCLQKMEKNDYSSVAIPALSTGAFHYPADRACSAIVEQITDQFKQSSKSVKKVILCDINEKTVKCFIAALQKNTGNTKVHYTFDSAHHGPTWLHTDDSAKGNRQERGRQKPPRSLDRNDGQVQIEVVQDELAKQTVDVIVNSTSKDLGLDRGIASKAISHAAGRDMQKECDANYQAGIKVGDVAVTGGYKLKCKKVYHVAVDTYERGQGALKGLWKVVENCLLEANKHGTTSIAFPPIGCGAQKYPIQEAASTMFSCISKFIEKTPNTSIKLIRFVIYTEDHDKFEVYMRESKGCQMRTPHATRGSHKRRTKSGQVINVSKDSAQFRVDCLDVNIRQGDITGEDADAIVASCNLDLDLTKGAVTKALLQKGGNEIKKDCDKQKAAMKNDGIAVTKAGNLNTKNIIHIDTKYKTKEWLEPIEKSLKKAEEMGITSVAFPTLGISVGCSPEGIADVMHEAMTNFTKHKTVKHLQEVRIIVFQSDIVQPLISAMKEAIEGIGSDSSEGGQDRNRHRSGSSHFSDVQSQPGTDKVSIKVYADGTQNCEKAINQLKKAVKDEWIVSNMKESVILTMPQKKIDEIMREGKNHNIQIDIDHDLGEIKFNGLVKNMMPVRDKINKIVRSYEKAKHEQQQAKLLANIVRWYYLKGNKQFPFPDDVNKTIEEAYKKKDAKVKVKDRSGGEYEIDFSSMTEHDVKNAKEKFTVLRRDVMEGLSKELPKTWKPMADSVNLMLVDLQKSDPEYARVLKGFTSRLQRSPNIVKIERIQNQALYTQYAAKRKQMLQQNTHITNNERVLWHGTAADAVTSINHHGFNRSYCGKNATAIGNGVYFAVNANYSYQSTYSPADSSGNKRMYRCLVLTGDFCAGKTGMRTPPQKQGQQSHILYDSVTNNTSNPAMFVIFHDCQAYPEHIITYK